VNVKRYVTLFLHNVP